MDTIIIPEKQLIAFAALSKRWTGADNDIFIELVNTKKELPAYCVVRKYKNKNTLEIECRLARVALYTRTYHDETGAFELIEDDPYDNREIFFNLADVNRVEKIYPELVNLFPLDTRPADNGAQTSPAATSPTGADDDQARAAATGTETAGKAQTAKARTARTEKALEQWKAAFKPMLTLAMELGAETERNGKATERTADALAKMFEDLEWPVQPKKKDREKHKNKKWKMSQAQFEFFRSCLPDEYKNQGGAPSQS